MAHDDAQRPHARLATGRLLLRDWQLADAPLLHELWKQRDPRVPAHRRLGNDGRPSVADQEDWIRRYDGEPAPGLLAVVAKESATTIGYCGLVPNSLGRPEPELAFEFLQAFWNQGFATEAARAVIAFAAAIGHHHLASTVRDWNRASLRVLDKVGFTETDRVESDPVHGNSLLLEWRS
ncbi:GNAT family N-acetyltransferase [Gryllotalpicola reticulitermitis]|uniref:GNAT family N-acetyltransferase n=1 Tax=Gryllotalpicola reticulitermitis TaxID=1184153 RepID=A0ABV8Q9C3_9MICO